MAVDVTTYRHLTLPANLDDLLKKITLLRLSYITNLNASFESAKGAVGAATSNDAAGKEEAAKSLLHQLKKDEQLAMQVASLLHGQHVQTIINKITEIKKEVMDNPDYGFQYDFTKFIGLLPFVRDGVKKDIATPEEMEKGLKGFADAALPAFAGAHIDAKGILRFPQTLVPAAKAAPPVAAAPLVTDVPASPQPVLVSAPSPADEALAHYAKPPVERPFGFPHKTKTTLGDMVAAHINGMRGKDPVSPEDAAQMNLVRQMAAKVIIDELAADPTKDNTAAALIQATNKRLEGKIKELLPELAQKSEALKKRIVEGFSENVRSTMGWQSAVPPGAGANDLRKWFATPLLEYLTHGTNRDMQAKDAVLPEKIKDQMMAEIYATMKTAEEYKARNADYDVELAEARSHARELAGAKAGRHRRQVAPLSENEERVLGYEQALQLEKYLNRTYTNQDGSLKTAISDWLKKPEIDPEKIRLSGMEQFGLSMGIGQDQIPSYEQKQAEMVDRYLAGLKQKAVAIAGPDYAKQYPGLDAYIGRLKATGQKDWAAFMNTTVRPREVLTAMMDTPAHAGSTLAATQPQAATEKRAGLGVRHAEELKPPQLIALPNRVLRRSLDASQPSRLGGPPVDSDPAAKTTPKAAATQSPRQEWAKEFLRGGYSNTN